MPAARLLMSSEFEVNPLGPTQEKTYPGVPPPVVTLIAPLLTPAHKIGVTAPVKVNAGGAVITMLGKFTVHAFASVTATAKVHAPGIFTGSCTLETKPQEEVQE